MTIENSPSRANSPPNVIFQSRERRTVASYERELVDRRPIELKLREALAREEGLRRQNTELVQQQEVLGELLGELEDTATCAARTHSPRAPDHGANPGWPSQ